MHDSLPLWTPDIALEAVVGCTELAVAEASVAEWLVRAGVDVDALGLAEGLEAAAWLDPSLQPWVDGLKAWLACLAAPPWNEGSIERLHITALNRWPSQDEHEQRRRWLGQLEGGLEHWEVGAPDWSLWIPCSAGYWVVYDGRGPAVKRHDRAEPSPEA